MTNANRAARIVDEYAMKFGYGSPNSSELLWLRERFKRAMNEAEGRAITEAHSGMLCSVCHGASQHTSDCALHNAPALPVGPCDCGASPL